MNLSFRKNKINAFTDIEVGKYTILFFRKLGQKNVMIDKVKLEIDKNKKFHYKKKDFEKFDRDLILFSDEKSNYYGIDFDSGNQLYWTNTTMPTNITLEQLDEYLNNGLILQLTNDIEKPEKSDKKGYIMLVIGVVLGIFVGFVIAQILGNGLKVS